MRRHRVFVYGTLRAGEANHGLLAGATYVGAARTEPRYELCDLGAFPALVRGGAAAVVGEIYEVDDRTLEALDRLEDHPRFYRRAGIRLEGGELVAAYLLRRDQVKGRPIIEGGDWLSR